MTTQRTKGPERTAIEGVLKKATSPVTAYDIAERAGLTESVVRVHLKNCINHGLAFNVNKDQRPATYVWGSAPPPVVTPEQRSCWTMGTTYTGEKAVPLREGSMRPFEIPSIGQEVRIRPFSLSSSASTNLNARPL